MAKSDEVKRQHWAQQIKDWQTSGVSQRAYCERAGHQFATFDYWRRKMLSNGAIPKPEPKATSTLTLVPVKVKSPPAECELVLHSPGGWQLHVPVAVDATWLAALLSTLA